MRQYIFFCGTLLTTQVPEEVAAIVKRLRRVGPAQVRGRLYDFGAFPGGVIDPFARTVIHGRLFLLPRDRRVLEALDRYEELDLSDLKRSLFVRQKAKFRLANGSSREGWIYVYNRRPVRASRIPGGDYVRLRNSRR